MRRAGSAPPKRWLVVTGTNGKTTTTSMLHAMLVAGGRRAVLCGNIGNPVIDMLAEPPNCSRSSCRASSCTGRRRCARRRARCSTSPRTTSTGTARWTRTPPTRRGRSTAGWRSSGSTTRSRPALLASAAAPVRVGFRLRRARRGRARGPRRRAGRPARSPTALLLADAASIPVAGPVGVARRARRRGAGPRRRTCPPMRSRTRCRRFTSAGTAPRRSPRSTGSTYVDDSKATNPHAAAGLDHRLPARGVDRRRSAQGRIGRRPGRRGGESPGRASC